MNADTPTKVTRIDMEAIELRFNGIEPEQKSRVVLHR